METFSVLGINHLGIAPKDVAKCRWFFGEVLGLENLGEELVKQQKTLTIMYQSFNGAGGEPARLELLEPEAGTIDSPIAKYLEKRGSGIHHVALTVDNVDTALKHLISKGVRMIDEAPRSGAHKTRIVFVHPESTGGILVELVEEGRDL